MPSARRCPVSAVGGPGTSCLPAVCDLHYTLMAVHLAILALDIGGTADTTNVPDVFVDEGVEALALTHHFPSLHHQVAVGVIATCLLRVHMLPQESLIHAILAIGGLHQPQPQQGQQQEQKQGTGPLESHHYLGDASAREQGCRNAQDGGKFFSPASNSPL